MPSPFTSLLSRISTPLPATHKRTYIPNGVRGTAATIRAMQELVSASKRDYGNGERQSIHDLVGRLIGECPDKDYLCYAKAIFYFCRDEIHYAYDACGVEVVEAPSVILRTKKADCDSIVVLLASLFESIGFPCQYVTIKSDFKQPNEFSHVYMRVKVPYKGWFGCDATMKEHPFGWEPPPTYERKYWPASLEDPEPKGDASMGNLGLTPADFPTMHQYNVAARKFMHQGHIAENKRIAAVRKQQRALRHGMAELGCCGVTALGCIPDAHMGYLGCDDCGGTCGTMMGLGDDDPEAVRGVLMQVWDGTYGSNLTKQRDEIKALIYKVADLHKDALTLQEPARTQQLAKLTQARNQFLNAQLENQKAMHQYNFIVGELQGLGVDASPLDLSGMNELGNPILLGLGAAELIAMGTAVVVMTTAFSVASSAITGGKSVIGETGDTLKAATGLVGILAAAAVGYVIYSAMKKRGKV